MDKNIDSSRLSNCINRSKPICNPLVIERSLLSVVGNGEEIPFLPAMDVEKICLKCENFLSN